MGTVWNESSHVCLFYLNRFGKDYLRWLRWWLMLGIRLWLHTAGTCITAVASFYSISSTILHVTLERGRSPLVFPWNVSGRDKSVVYYASAVRAGWYFHTYAHHYECTLPSFLSMDVMSWQFRGKGETTKHPADGLYLANTDVVIASQEANNRTRLL